MQEGDGSGDEEREEGSGSTEGGGGSDDLECVVSMCKYSMKDVGNVYFGHKHKDLGVKNGPGMELWAILG
eukprot:1160619-Pelagomonas_calceolata.AAC.6